MQPAGHRMCRQFSWSHGPPAWTVSPNPGTIAGEAPRRGENGSEGLSSPDSMGRSGNHGTTTKIVPARRAGQPRVGRSGQLIQEISDSLKDTVGRLAR